MLVILFSLPLTKRPQTITALFSQRQEQSCEPLKASHGCYGRTCSWSLTWGSPCLWFAWCECVRDHERLVMVSPSHRHIHIPINLSSFLPFRIYRTHEYSTICRSFLWWDCERKDVLVIQSLVFGVDVERLVTASKHIDQPCQRLQKGFFWHLHVVS